MFYQVGKVFLNIFFIWPALKKFRCFCFFYSKNNFVFNNAIWNISCILRTFLFRDFQKIKSVKILEEKKNHELFLPDTQVHTHKAVVQCDIYCA
jgi:hypothetical protein